MIINTDKIQVTSHSYQITNLFSENKDLCLEIIDKHLKSEPGKKLGYVPKDTFRTEQQFK